jgi:hypothetical protein
MAMQTTAATAAMRACESTGRTVTMRGRIVIQMRMAIISVSTSTGV